MGQRSDAKSKMVKAARELIRERGYHATALSDVVERSAAPRGSIYFHFPGGKTQLGVEAAKAYAGEQVGLIERAAEGSGSAVELITAYVARARENLVGSGYTEGCTLAPLVLEGARESDLLADAGSAAFSLIIESLAFQFAFFGIGRVGARELAEVVVSGVEGALVTARALRSPAPFDSMLAALVNQAARLGMTEPRSTSGPSRARGQADLKETRPMSETHL
jgi:TetR/AcrR family transcriptional regulator, lmrAB and yxaGH operons repressor